MTRIEKVLGWAAIAFAVDLTCIIAIFVFNTPVIIYGCVYTVIACTCLVYCAILITVLRDQFNSFLRTTMYLYPITTETEAAIEGEKQQSAIAYYFARKVASDKFYSMRNGDTGEPVLSMVTNDAGEITHIVGYRNRPPTKEEFDVLKLLLDELGIKMHPSLNADKNIFP